MDRKFYDDICSTDILVPNKYTERFKVHNEGLLSFVALCSYLARHCYKM
jgi:hypothetical protein